MINYKRIAREIDVVFCVIVLPLLLSIIPIERMFVNSRIFTVMLVAFLYATYFLFRKIHFPRLIMSRRFGMAALFVISVSFVAYLLAHFPFTDDFLLQLPEGEFPRVTAHRSQRVWFLFLVVCGFSLSIDLTFELFSQVLARRELEYEKNKAELSLYKAQINPHFLFNSLNTIYGMIITGSEKTEEAFSRFTDMLRYMYDFPMADKVSMRREVEYIGNYIGFQSLRYGDGVRVEWNVSIDDDSIAIHPMILINFIENAFKFGASSCEESYIEARAEMSDRHMVFEVRNSIVNRSNEGQVGIGIENCRRRLELLYNGRYSLDISEKDDVYNVRLELDL